MASVTFKRGTRAEIEATAKQDGQILMETDQTNNKMYVDLQNNNRVRIGNSNVDDISGITDSLTATSSNIALSAAGGNNLQRQIDTLNSNFNNCVKFSGGENAVMQRYYLNCGSVAPRSLSQKIITFGKEMPSANYIVSLTMIGTPAYWSNIAISASDKLKTGFVINLFNNGDYTVDNVYIDWIVLSY